MGEVRRFGPFGHYRAESSSYVLRFRGGRLLARGRALGFWFLALSTSVAEVPVDDQELAFLFRGRTTDFQDTHVQGAVTFRIKEPDKLAERVDFSIDLTTGAFRKKPIEALTELVSQLAQQLAVSWIGEHDLATTLTKGPAELRLCIERGSSPTGRSRTSASMSRRCASSL